MLYNKKEKSKLMMAIVVLLSAFVLFVIGMVLINVCYKYADHKKDPFSFQMSFSATKMKESLDAMTNLHFFMIAEITDFIMMLGYGILPFALHWVMYEIMFIMYKSSDGKVIFSPLIDYTIAKIILLGGFGIMTALLDVVENFIMLLLILPQYQRDGSVSGASVIIFSLFALFKWISLIIEAVLLFIYILVFYAKTLQYIVWRSSRVPEELLQAQEEKYKLPSSPREPYFVEVPMQVINVKPVVVDEPVKEDEVILEEKEIVEEVKEIVEEVKEVVEEVKEVVEEQQEEELQQQEEVVEEEAVEEEPQEEEEVKEEPVEDVKEEPVEEEKEVVEEEVKEEVEEQQEEETVEEEPQQEEKDVEEEQQEEKVVEEEAVEEEPQQEEEEEEVEEEKVEVKEAPVAPVVEAEAEADEESSDYSSDDDDDFLIETMMENADLHNRKWVAHALKENDNDFVRTLMYLKTLKAMSRFIVHKKKDGE